MWIDKEGIEPSDRWRRSALEAIECSDAFVFVLSRHSLAYWDARSGAQLSVFKGPPSGLYEAVFSPDGSAIVTASSDGSARIFSTELTGPLPSLERFARGLVTRPFTPQERKRFLAGIAG